MEQTDNKSCFLQSTSISWNAIFSLKPAFSVHVDEGNEHRSNSLSTPHKLAPGESKVLSARKPAEEHDNVAIALFEPPNPMVKPMYCKHLVYQVWNDSFKVSHPVNFLTQDLNMK